ncbi:von Willebrand factor type A domain protein [Hydrogenophaga sp. RAC07]|uniref:VWA domain-containing protein n=1 Tax=Hydrogenophaga sp. RAC07 TaxID=1842537 RepID=UPI00083E663E|nr:VWA domain-containing protein [Hydrogenophaga sp. RAC07]AOF84989.1 von Willebrand factor type A domain protein [Hydrogenophaga sp. RAC07]
MVSAPSTPYHHLETLPRELWRWAVVCSSGQPAARLPHMARWMTALMAGALPDTTDDFGDAPATQSLRPLLLELELLTLTQGSAPLTRQVMQSLLWHLDSLVDRPPGEPRDQAIARMRAEFRDSWDVQRQGWDEVLSLLQSLGDLAHLRWDDLQGHLNRREWGEARRIGELLQRLPQLARFIDGVGRREHAQQPPAITTQPDTRQQLPAARHPADEDERRPEPTAVDGVRRSRTLARMTGGESLNLTRPVLRRLWRARFAEAQLLTYDDRAREQSKRPLPQPEPQALRQAATHAGRGPLIVCLDTSGSMRGAPENVAKACVLQALRSAHAGRRACRLLAFGGPDELLERDLAMDADGLSLLLDLMGQSFDGGTDVQTPLERAVALVQTTGWHEADVLIVGDGEFGVTHATLAQLRDAKQRLALRVHGILIGDRETVGLAEVCDQLHWVRDWRRWGNTASRVSDDFSPVHSRSLTALYFPNAIRR